MCKRTIVLFFSVPFFLAGPRARAQIASQASAISPHNPVWNHDFPDPTVIRTPGGEFYAYGTQGGLTQQTAQGARERHALIQVARSKDGIHWQWVGDALPGKPGWASQNFWAPHVTYDVVHKRYILYYAAKSKETGTGMCIGIALSERPEGPFIRYSEAHRTHSSIVLQSNGQWMAPGHNSAVSDASGRLWMYYHAISRHTCDSAYAKNPEFGNISRVMMRDRIRFKNGWSVVGDGTPAF